MESLMLELPLKVLKIIGLHPTDNSWFAHTKAVVAVTAGVVVLVTSVMEMCIVEWNIVSVVPEVEALTATLQGLIRWATLFILKKDISELVTESKTFWRITDEDPNEETEAQFIVEWLWKGMRFFLVAVCGVGIVSLFAAMIFTWGEALPFVSWFPRDVAYGYLMFYIVQAFYVPAVLSMMVGADGLYVAFCGQLIAQFKLLSRRLENSTNIENRADYMINVQESICYHVKLLAFGEKIGEVFSGLFLGQYLISVTVCCIELFLLSEKRDDLTQIAAFVAYMTSVLTEMALFCFLSEAVMDESVNVGWAIYSSEWYSKNIKEVGVYVNMIGTRASKPILFTGCGLIVMGRILWFNILKLSVSLFTLLTSLQ